eukprot:403377239
MRFPRIQNLIVDMIKMEEGQFFRVFEKYLKSDDSQHLVIFKSKFLFELNNLDISAKRDAMDYLFEIIVDINVPIIKLTFNLACNVGFINPLMDSSFFTKFQSYKRYVKYENFGDQEIQPEDKCNLSLVFYKDANSQVIYFFDFVYRKRPHRYLPTQRQFNLNQVND